MKIAIVGDPHITESVRCRKDDYLEAILNKIEYIATNNDKVIFLGDLFDRCSNSNLLFNTVYKVFSKPKYKNKFMSLLGNHDLYFHNIASLNKTTIGSLELTGVLTILKDTFTIDNITFDVSSCIKDLSDLGDSDNYKILLGHNYVEMNDCPKESFTKEEIIKLNYNMMFLGHDHSPYEEERVGNTTLVRMGSLCRKDTQMYNKDRKIYYYQIDSNTLEYIKLEVPSKPFNEVYIDGAFDKSQVNKKSVYRGLSALLEKFDRKNTNNLSIVNVLKNLHATEKHISYLRGVHRDNNISFD